MVLHVQCLGYKGGGGGGKARQVIGGGACWAILVDPFGCVCLGGWLDMRDTLPLVCLDVIISVYFHTGH